MREEEFRTKQIEWDKKSLKSRVERWKQIVPATYDVPLPELVWGYLSMADEMYIVGQFAGCIVFCASLAELILADQIKKNSQTTSDKIDRSGLDVLVKRVDKLGIVGDDEKSRLDNLRKLRNYLIHGNTDRLAQMAKRTYSVSGSDNSFLDADFYVHSGFKGGIDQDALKYLALVRDLSVKFYWSDSRIVGKS